MIGYILLAILVIFFLVILVRTLTFKPKAQAAVCDGDVSFDEEKAIRALQELVKCRTISSYDHALEDEEEFRKFRELLPRLYPNVFRVCTLKELPGRALLLRWPGKTDADAAVLMAHSLCRDHRRRRSLGKRHPGHQGDPQRRNVRRRASHRPGLYPGA